MLLAVASKGRAGRVTTLAVLPSATLYVPELEVDAYARTGAQWIVGVPNNMIGITKTRNWILRNSDERRVVMIDDDVAMQGWIELQQRQAKRHKLDEQQWLGEFAKLFDLTEQLDYRIWGVATDGAKWATFPYKPFVWQSYITASCMGIINDGRTYFDESYPVKEDYELCARCISEDGGVVGARYLYWQNHHWSSAGGCHDYRTQIMENDCVRRLRKAYPRLVRVSQRASKEWVIEIGA